MIQQWHKEIRKQVCPKLGAWAVQNNRSPKINEIFIIEKRAKNIPKKGTILK